MPGVTNATAGVLACAEALVVADVALDPARLINPDEVLVAVDGILDPAIAIDTGDALVVADKVLDSASLINPNEVLAVDDEPLDPREGFDPDGLVVPSEVFEPVIVSDPTAEVDAAAEFTVPAGVAIAPTEGLKLLAEAELNVGERTV